MIIRMKILHYIPSIDRASGGVGAYMQLLTKELGKLVELHVVTHKSENELDLQNCTLHYIGNSLLPWSSTKKEFISLLDSLRPDVFHSNCCWLPLSALTSIWAKSKGYKVVYTPHGMLEPWIMQRHYWTRKFPAIHLFQKEGVAVADLVHSTADSECKNLIKLAWNKKIYTIPNCVDLEGIDKKLSSINQLGTSVGNAKTILFLSRVHVKKGINFLIEAVAALRESLDGWKVKIAGEGEEGYVEELKLLAKELGVDNKVEFLGGVYGDEKWKLYHEASLFVLPTHSENFGIVVAEALACKVPVITTKGTPWKELQDLNCGWWAEVGTQPTVDALLSFLHKTEDELRIMGENGRKLVEEKYSCKTVALQFTKMYSELLGK